MKVTVLSISYDKQEERYLLDLVVNTQVRRFIAHVQADLVEGKQLLTVTSDEGMIQAFGTHARLRAQVLRLVSVIYAGKLVSLPLELDDDVETNLR